MVATVTAGAAAYYRRNGSDTSPTLTTVAVSRGSVVHAVEATGTLEAVTTVDVRTQMLRKCASKIPTSSYAAPGN